MAAEAAGLLSPFEEVVRQATLILSTGVEGLSALIVAYAVLEALWRLLTRRGRGGEGGGVRALRLRLGYWLGLVLELLLAADILQTAVAPTWDDIGKLAAIAAIRTALNYFLEREVREESRMQAEEAPSGAPLPRRQEERSV